jgi:hypothetical protein
MDLAPDWIDHAQNSAGGLVHFQRQLDSNRYLQIRTTRAAEDAVVAFIYLFSPSYNLDLNGNRRLYTTMILLFSLRIRVQAFFQLFSTCFLLNST